MNRSQLSHDINNMLERLRIMHELVKDQHFQTISKEEIKKDLKETLEKLAEHFESLIQ